MVDKHEANKSILSGFITLGAIFLILGFVQQDFSVNFESGFFILGIFFVLGGLAALIFRRRDSESHQ